MPIDAYSVWGGKPNERPHVVTGPCLNRMFNAAALGGTVGTFVGACHAAWYPDPVVGETRFGGVVGAKSTMQGLFRSLGRPIVYFSTVATVFATTECLAESFRNKADSYNAGIGGVLTGVVMAGLTRRIDFMAASGLGMGVLMFGLDLSGPDTVWDHKELNEKMYGMLPAKEVDSETVKSLKEKYPKFKDL